MDAMETWVQDTFAPVVLTCATAEAERIAQKNNLSVADLLNGFARIQDADTPLRSVTHPIQLQRFNFRFLAASQFATLGLNEATEQLNASVKRHPPPHASASAVELDIPPVKSVEDVPTYLRVIGADEDSERDPMPWYNAFKYTLMDSFRCEEYSLLWHPVAMLVVISSTDPNPRHSFEELTAPRSLPTPFQQGLYDATLVPKFYVVLHDVLETEGTSIDADAILQSLNISSVNGSVLRVNSLPVEEAPVPSQFASTWTDNPYVRPPLFPQQMDTFSQVSDGVGTLLSSDDVDQLRAFVRDFGLRFMLSSLEGRIFQLNEVVSAMKKGVKNVFKSWLRKPNSRPANAAANGGIAYRCDSIEAQTRLLADTAFLVRDYDLALQMYRLVRDDYKSDKSVFHNANVNEMIALCLLMTKGSPMQMTNALDSANAIYAKTTTPVTQRLAIRTAVIAGEIYHTLSKSGLFTDYMDNASAALIRGSTMEQGICAAVLMERAALCDLRARLPKFRKYGFRMVMAGHVYDSLGHEQHSARCYSLARAVYDCSGWFLVEDHINFMLAQQANKLDDRMASINLFLKLIGTGRNSASQQEAMLYDFSLMVKDFLATERADSPTSFSRSGALLIKNGDGSANKLLVRDLCMPELDDKSTVVFASTNAFGIDRAIDGNLSEADKWIELVEILDKQNKLHQYVTSATGNEDSPKSWFAPSHLYAGYRSKKNAAIKKPENYVLGEQIYVEFVMKNALSCAVDVEDIHLYGKFETADDATESFDVPEHKESGEERIVIDSVNLQLLPCSEERVRLAVCPKIRGKLTLIGVRWSICGGDVQGEHAFDIPGPLLQDTRAHREARARAPNTSLIANVVESMPWLGVKIEGVLPEAFVGELMQLKISLVNSGTATLGGLQVCCTDLMLCASASNSVEDLCEYIGATGHAVDLSHVTLAPGETREVVMWARGSVPGQRHVPLLFKYRTLTSEGEKSSLSRTVKMKLDLHLLPCVDVSYSIEPSFGNTGEYILGITVSNQRNDHQETAGHLDGVVRLEELLCVSKYWSVEKLSRPQAPTADVRDSLHLGFLEASTSYFRVIRRENTPDTDGFEQLLCKLPLLSSQGVTDTSANLPVGQFLCLENANGLVRSGGANAGDGSAENAKRGGGFRTIQSVRRENKALKNAAGDDGSDQKPQKEPQPTSKDALFTNSDTDGHIVLVWSTDCNSSYSDKVAGVAPRRAIGQANLASVQIRPPVQENSCPLTVTLKYTDSVELRKPVVPGMKTQLSLAELDIVMVVCNESAPSALPLDVTVDMLRPEESQTPASSSQSTNLQPVSLSGPPRGSAPRFFWSGITRKQVSQFQPNSRATINLKACFTAPGIYDLNRFRFVVQPPANSGQPPSTFMIPAEYLVYVKGVQSSNTLLPTAEELLVPVP